MNVQKKLALAYIRTKLNLLSVISKRRAGQEVFRLFCTPLLRYKGKEADIFKNGQPLQLKSGAETIKGYRCNFPQVKKILLLHGFSSSCHKFDKYAAALVSKGYEVIAFDAPAHGASSGKTVNAVEYAAMIEMLNAGYGPFDAYLAHSFGGIAVSLALENMPHNENTRVVLIAPATETKSAIDGAFKMLGIKNMKLRQAIDDVIFNISGKRTEWFSVRRAMQNIKASVLWVHDEDDEITPLADALKVKDDALPHIKFHITKGLGHQKIYRDAGVKKEILNFL
jgi:esterase/lipase